MKLYTYFRSSAAYRVRIALNLKGLQYESIPKMLTKKEQHAPEYLAINPYGMVPALQDDGQVLFQSIAIIEYLDEKHPVPRLLPEDLVACAQVRALAFAVACDIHPLNNLRVLNYLRYALKQDKETVRTWIRHWMVEGFHGLEAQVRELSTAGRYCFGDTVTLADVCLVPQMMNARRFETDLAPYPTLVKICEHLEAIPQFAAARPEVQPEASQV